MSECPDCGSEEIVEDIDGKMRCLACGRRWTPKYHFGFTSGDSEKEEDNWEDEEEEMDGGLGEDLFGEDW